MREFGFSAAELDRAKKWMAAFYERAYNERDKTESGSFAQEYLNYFLDERAEPGHRLRVPARQAAAAGHHRRRSVDAGAARCSATTAASCSRRRRRRPGITVPTEAELQAALGVGGHGGRHAVERHGVDARADGAQAASRRPSRRAARSPTLGVTIVRFANGVEAWLKPTDFKNDQVLFTLDAPGGASLAPPADYPRGVAGRPRYVELSGAGGLKALDLQKLLAGKLASASPFIALSTHGVSGSAAPAQLETALQLLYQEFTAPGDDPEAFALLKRQLDGGGRQPRTVAAARSSASKLAQVNTSNHYTSQPLTAERVATLDREKMIAFYRERFSNAADFTFFMVGAFKVDEALPLLAQYVGVAAVDRQADRRSSRTSALCFPDDDRAARRWRRAASRAARR